MKNIIKRQVYGLYMYRGCTCDAKAEVKCEEMGMLWEFLWQKFWEKKKICFCLVSTVLKRIWPHSVLLFQVGIRKENYQIQRKWRWWWMRNTVHYITFQVSFCETYSNNPFLSFCLSLCKFPSFYLSLVYFSLSLSLLVDL